MGFSMIFGQCWLRQLPAGRENQVAKAKRTLHSSKTRALHLELMAVEKTVSKLVAVFMGKMMITYG